MGWFPDRVLRLFRRGKARFTDDVVHERVVCDGVVARLPEPILHHPVARLEDAIRRIDRYSTLGAEKLVASDRKVSFISGLIHGIGTFLRDLFPEARLPRRRGGLPARGRERGRDLLSLHEGVAREAAP